MVVVVWCCCWCCQLLVVVCWFVVVVCVAAINYTWQNNMVEFVVVSSIVDDDVACAVIFFCSSLPQWRSAEEKDDAVTRTRVMMKGVFNNKLIIEPKVALALVSFFLGQLGDGLNIFQVRRRLIAPEDEP
jgi:hypothetical protein